MSKDIIELDQSKENHQRARNGERAGVAKLMSAYASATMEDKVAFAKAIGPEKIWDECIVPTLA